MANIMRIGGGGGKPNELTVAVDTGAIVTATNGDKTVVGTSVGGNAVLKLPKAGTWRIIATKDGQTAEDSIVIVDDYPVEVSFGLPLSSLAEGALIKLNENGSGVNFYLAKHDYESGLNGAGRSLVVRKDVHSKRQWDAENVSAYSASDIDTWMNSTYKGLLDSAAQTMIGTTKFYYTIGNGNNTITTLERPVFLLSAVELGKPSGHYSAEGTALSIASTLQIAYLDGAATFQWVRSVRTDGYNSYAFYYAGTGVCSSGNCSNNLGARPCFTLPATALVNPEPNADGSYTLIV